MIYAHQPVAFAAMEGHFHTDAGAPLVLIGQPDMEEMTIDNPIEVPKMLSFLTHRRWDAQMTGLIEFDHDLWPTSIPMLYYAYHIMAGLGTIFIAVMALAGFFLWRGTLDQQRWLMWILMLALPFPFIANSAGWMTAELGRQPWIIYGLMRTSAGHSINVSAGNAMFSLLGFAGLYAMLSALFLFIALRIITRGPAGEEV